MMDLFGGETRGALLFVALASVPITVVLALVVTAAYGRAVERSMRIAAGAKTVVPGARPPVPGRGAELEVHRFAAGSNGGGGQAASPPAAAALRAVRSRTLGAAIVYAAAGAVHATVALVLFFILSGQELRPLPMAAVWLVLAWPIAPAAIIAGVGNRRLRAAGIAIYFALLLLVYGLLGIAGRGGIGDGLMLWAWYMGFPTLLLLLVSNRRLRGAGPPALVVVALTVTGILTGLNFTGRAILASGSLESGCLFAPLGLAIVVLVALLGWLVVRRLARRHRQKRSSDQSLRVDAWFMMFTLWETLVFAPARGGWSLLVIFAFVAYKAVVRGGFKLLDTGPAARAARPLRLLLLRVFGHRQRSGRLLDELGHKWRYAGPINLIAAPDLAAANLEPHELLDFLGGRLARAFVTGDEDLDRRLPALDVEPDPDGRYRVNEFFCRADTWRKTMRRLAASSDAVLMDLRSFGPGNRGCLLELEQLVDNVPLERVVLLVDVTTNRFVLEETLRGLLRQASPGSPSHGRPRATVRMVSVAEQSAKEVEGVLLALYEAASSPGGTA